jgi:hypothetical protein
MNQDNSENKYKYWDSPASLTNLANQTPSNPEVIDTSYSENDDAEYSPAINNYSETEDKELLSQYHSAKVNLEAIDSSLEKPPETCLTHIQNLERLALKTTLDYTAQEELSKLIILHNKIENTSRKDWLKLVDYAILILEKKPTEKKLVSQFKDFSFLQKIVNSYEKIVYGESEHINLRLARNIRKKIQWQLLLYNSPLLGVVTASGKDYTQLISGLTWFFFIFIIFPYYAIALFISIEKNDIQKDIEFVNQQLLKENSRLGEELQNLKDTNNNLTLEAMEKNNNIQQLQTQKETYDTQINELKSQIESLRKEKTDLEEIIKNSPSKPITNNTQANILQDLKKDYALLVGDYSFKNDLNDNITSKFYPNKNLNSSVIIAQNNTTPINTDNSLNQPTAPINQSVLKNQLYFENRETITLVVVVVISGALGSAISVIVRADKIISQHNKTTQSLFFTGFFKPIIGMSFAIFLFAVLESNILGISLSMSGEKKLYMYIALSFVAGFSERLGKDIISKTEETIIGDEEKESEQKFIN